MKITSQTNPWQIIILKQKENSLDKNIQKVENATQ